MKTITRDQMFDFLQQFQEQTKTNMSEVIADLETKNFAEVEIIAPQHDGDGWQFNPIIIKD